MTLVGAAVSWPIAALALQSAKVHRLAIVHPAAERANDEFEHLVADAGLIAAIGHGRSEPPTHAEFPLDQSQEQKPGT